MWVHCSSELMDCHPIIVFWYEATRGTDHLRKLFGEFLGYIICDAYISYQVIESECGGITVAGCLMHCRRYFAEALFIMNVADMSEEECFLQDPFGKSCKVKMDKLACPKGTKLQGSPARKVPV